MKWKGLEIRLDPRWGEPVAAAVVLKSESTLTKEEIIEYCRQKLSGYKAPKYVVFKSNLPTTSAGKLLKRSLKDEYQNLSQEMEKI